MDADKLKIEEAVTSLLLAIKEDPSRPGLIDTPKRVARMYADMLTYDEPLPRLVKIKNGEDGIFYDEMLKDEGYFFSLCEHHVVPFFGTYFFAYIPNQWLLGASKISRIVDYYSGRLQIAERLVHQVTLTIEEEIAPKGQILVMAARHLCKEMRGVKKWNSPYEAIAVRGCFKENTNNCKEEFLMRIK